jgi:hypothetical protein
VTQLLVMQLPVTSYPVMQLPMTSFPVMQLPVTSYPVTSRFGDAASGTTSLHHLK